MAKLPAEVLTERRGWRWRGLLARRRRPNQPGVGLAKRISSPDDTGVPNHAIQGRERLVT
jgi:hypothetical protein